MENIKSAIATQSQPPRQPQQANNTQSMQSVTQEVAKLNQEAKVEAYKSEDISKKDVQDLVKDLNKSIGPFNTSIRFGFDNNSSDFYVSVLEADSNKLIRRFPAEKAFELLPKIQDVSGLLFDLKG